MKNRTSLLAQKSLIDRALPKTQSNMASSLAQLIILSLSKDTRKDFHVIIAFGHSTFIASQLLFVAMNMVLKRYLACRTFRKCKPYSNEELFIHTYILFTCKIDADNQLHNCVCGALFVKMMVL